MFTINSLAEQRLPAPESMRPENICIVFDLHGVIAHFKPQVTWRACIRLWYQHPLLIVHIGNPWFWMAVYEALKTVHPYVPERLVQAVAQKVPALARAYQELLTIFNSYAVDTQVVAYMRELKQAGYTVILGSNIGPDLWDAYKRGLGQELVGVCSHEFTSHMAGGWYKKPAIAYYHQLIDQIYLLQHPRRIIFIDDRAANVEQCVSLGYPAIRFYNLSNLKDHLAVWGVLV